MVDALEAGIKDPKTALGCDRSSLPCS
jgi:hypothetical protein